MFISHSSTSTHLPCSYLKPCLQRRSYRRIQCFVAEWKLSDSKVDWGSKTSKHLKFVCLSNFSRLQRNSEYRMTPIIFGHYDWLIYHVLESRYSICSKIENITHYHANWVWILLVSELISVIRYSVFRCVCKNFQYSGATRCAELIPVFQNRLFFIGSHSCNQARKIMRTHIPNAPYLVRLKRRVFLSI